MKARFEIDKRDRYWVLDIFRENEDEDEFGFGMETFHEETYIMFTDWCAKAFKTWLYPKRVRRMSYTQYHFASKRDLDWFVLNWSGVDIPDN